MASNTDFLRMIKPGCFTVYKRINILPSIAAAQAVLESNWGRSSLSTQGHNYFGIKGSSSVPSMKFMTKEFINGRMVTIPQYFQKFESFTDCIEKGYITRVVGGDRYKKARGVKDARTAITIIKQAGYATDPSYVSKIMSVINANGLDKWDKEAIAGGDGGNEVIGGGSGGAPVELEGKQFYTFNNDFIKKNNYTRPGLKLSGVAAIVLHDAGTQGLAASSIRSSLDKGNGGKKNGYHILIDKKDTVAIVPLDEVVYHTNTKDLQVDFLKKSTSYYPSGNADLTTISIGLCSEKDGTFDDAMVARAIAVCAELVNHYNLPMEVILRGFDLDGSLEPLAFYNNYFDYTTFLGLVDYQRNQNTPLMNEDLQALYDNRDAGGGSSTGISAGELISATSGSRQKLLKLAFEMESWGMSYSQAKRYQIHKNGFADCSSFTQYIYKNTLGIDPGITTKFQIKSGKAVARKDAKPGDLVFWCPPGRSTSVPGNVSHVGMVIDDGAKYCIHTSYSAGPGRTVQRLAIDIMSLSFMQIRTYVKEEGESSGSAPATPESGGSIGDIDLSKKYVIEVKSSLNSYNSDSDSGTSVKRIAKGTVVNVLSIGGYGFRIGEGEWILKKDSASFEMRAKGSNSDPIGTAVVIGVAQAKTAPSIVSPNVLLQGKPKVYGLDTTLPVYGIQNSMLLVKTASNSMEYIPQISTEYTSRLAEYPVYTDRESNDDDLIPLNPALSSKFKAKKITDFIDPVSGAYITGGTIAVRDGRFSVGSKVEVKIPSMPSYNGIYLVASHHDEDEDLVYIYTADNSDVVLLGTRVGTARSR